MQFSFLGVFGLLAVSAMAQRPFYAGSRPIGVPELASRFRDPDTEQNIVNRWGESSSSSGTTIKIPVDARGDEELVKRLQQWPKENQPFWLLNAEHIEKHRNPKLNRNQLTSRFSSPSGKTRPIRPVIPRSSFLGPIDRR